MASAEKRRATKVVVNFMLIGVEIFLGSIVRLCFHEVEIFFANGKKEWM